MSRVVCTKCKEEKDGSDFKPDLKKRNGLTSWCRDCLRTQNTLRERPKKSLFRYGISMKEVEAARKRQNNKCAICQEEKELVIDHDHETFQFRGLLCRCCNLALGYLSDNPELFRSAIRYLEQAPKEINLERLFEQL